MILAFEHDGRRRLASGMLDPAGSRFNWRPNWFSGRWDGLRTWRLGWGMWSVSYYPSPGLRDFFDHVERTAWQGADDEA